MPNLLRKNKPCTHSCQAPLCANPIQRSTSDQRPLLCGVSRDLIRLTSEECTVPTTRNWHTTPLTAPRPRLHPARPHSPAYDIYSAGLPPQCLVKLQFRYRLCIDTRIVQQPIMPSFRCQVCRLVKLKSRDCLKHRFRSSKLLPNLHLLQR